MTETPDVPAIRLPCGHLADRPEKSAATVACPCGRIWQVLLTAGGRAWNAWELVP